MAKSALLKSSLAKKYWMAITGLFLCVFLVGHLVGNLQLIYGTPLQFNQYAYFMTTNPAVKVLSYLTYFSILFHAVDGIVLTIQNRKARPIRYAKENAAANSKWASRNMAVLGTLILVFIASHMVHFWAKMHFSEMPLQSQTIVTPMGELKIYNTTNGGFVDAQQIEMGAFELKNGTDFYIAGSDEVIYAKGYKDLYKITIDFFKDEKLGLLYTIFYVLSMVVLGFHLYHGFASSFQSLGATTPKYNTIIKNIGTVFAIIVPLLFAIIPIYIRFLI
ncbi:MAG: succinate dehydrogenase cytochrome b subunit [Bacteroidota bacterium]|nr:succinate dehydrogenase cytochrome b subunit [Bacteroidota bacterium]